MPEADPLAAPSPSLAQSAQTQTAEAARLARRVAPHRATRVERVTTAGVLLPPRRHGRARVGARERREQSGGPERRRLAERGLARDVGSGSPCSRTAKRALVERRFGLPIVPSSPRDCEPVPPGIGRSP